MFTCFMGSASFVYFFHVFQNEPSIRGYLTALSLLTSYAFQFQTYDARMSKMWACFFAWVIYSNIFYDVRTHFYGLYRVAKHVCFAFFPFVAATKIMRNSRVLKILFWAVVLIGPDLSANVYGNALFSVLRVFSCTILIMTRIHGSDKQEISKVCMEEFAWVYFCHETVLSFVVLQLMFDFLPIEINRRYPFFRRIKNVLPADVIGANDVPSYIIGANVGKRNTVTSVP